MNRVKYEIDITEKMLIEMSEKGLIGKRLIQLIKDNLNPPIEDKKVPGLHTKEKKLRFDTDSLLLPLDPRVKPRFKRFKKDIKQACYYGIGQYMKLFRAKDARRRIQEEKDIREFEEKYGHLAVSDDEAL